MMRTSHLIAILCFGCSSYGQVFWQSINSAGNSVIKSGLELDWVIGQVASTSFSNDRLQLDRGFVQFANEDISTPTIEAENSVIVNVFPNPSSQYFEVKTSHDQKIKFEVVDILGNRFDSGKFKTHLRRTSKDLNVGRYFIVLRAESKILGVYPLIIQ